MLVIPAWLPMKALQYARHSEMRRLGKNSTWMKWAKGSKIADFVEEVFLKKG